MEVSTSKKPSLGTVIFLCLIISILVNIGAHEVRKMIARNRAK